MGNSIPLLGAALCGAGIGAEIDLMAFFVGRYFGLKAFGKIRGLMFMLFNVGTRLGPALSGRASDLFQSYFQSLWLTRGVGDHGSSATATW
jgi:hypothetical protein